MDTITEQDLAADLEAVVDEVHLTGQSVTIQRCGRDVAILASYEEWQHVLDGWVTLEIEWDSEVLTTLRQFAKATGTTIPNLVRNAIQEYIEAHHLEELEAREERCI